MHYYFEVWKKYATFSGRARRKEFWIFFLFNIIISFLLTFVGNLILGFKLNIEMGEWLANLYGLAILIPSIAVGVRRLHDTGRSGWWLLINIVPIVGNIVYVVLLCLNSQTGENKYGLNPKETSSLQPTKSTV